MDAQNGPTPGDVLITSEAGRHLLAVVPHPHRLSLSQFSQALEIANRWAAANGVRVWHETDGIVRPVSEEAVSRD